MEERKTIFDYIGQVFIIFGFSIAILNIFCIFVGEDAQDISTIFFTDKIIKRMSVAIRSVCMLTSIVVLVVICAVMFDWFPVTMWQSWAGFLITFALCFVGSLLLMTLKERTENRKMEEALQRLKEQEGKEGIK